MYELDAHIIDHAILGVVAGGGPLDLTANYAWTGVHTHSAQDVHNAGVSLGTSGRLNSAVVNAPGAIGLYFKPTNAFPYVASPNTGWLYRMDDSSGNTLMSAYDGGPVEFGGSTSGSTDGVFVVGAQTAKNAGIFFAPSGFSGSGQSLLGVSNAVAGGYFRAIPVASTTPS